MRFKLEPRLEPSRRLTFAAPFLACLLTMALAALIFSIAGYEGLRGVKEIFITPLLNPLKWNELFSKAAPLVLIAVGLSIGFRAGVWNIGAEGQYILGGLAATGVALATWEMEGYWILPLMCLAGIIGGMLWAAVPALLKVRLGVSEILTSLMLVYVAIQLLNYLVGGPWKDPLGFGFLQTRLFSDWQVLPFFDRRNIIHLGVPIAFLCAALFWILMTKSLFGFQVRVAGEAPKAARLAGFNASATVVLSLMIGGGLAGLAGAFEVAGPFSQMVPQFPTGYGFTAIIVAFLGRLNPLAIIPAGLLLAITYVGGIIAQSQVGLPSAAIEIIQAMTLFILLAIDVLVRYRIVRAR